MTQRLSHSETEPHDSADDPPWATWPDAVDVEPADLSVNKADVIFTAAEFPEASNPEIAAKVGVDPSCVSRTLCNHWPERAPGSVMNDPLLTPDDVDEIRRRLLNDPDASVKSLAEEYEPKRASLGKYVRGERKHVEPDTTMPPLRWNASAHEWQPITDESDDETTGPGPSPALSAAQIDEIRLRLLAGENRDALAAEFDVSPSTVRKHAIEDTPHEDTDIPPISYDGSAWTLDPDTIPDLAQGILRKHDRLADNPSHGD